MSGDVLAEAQLGFLSGVLNAPSPTFLAAGGEADIYAFSLSDPGQETEWGSIPLVCRIARNADQGPQILKKAAIQGALTALDYPVPRAVAAGTSLDGLSSPFMVMERLRGRPALACVAGLTLLGAGMALVVGFFSTGGPATVLALFGLLGALVLFGACARTLVQLHRLPVARFVEELEVRGVSRTEVEFRGEAALDWMHERVERSRVEELRPGMEWLRMERPRLSCAVV